MKMTADDFNLRFAGTSSGTDEVNATFYGRFQYPWEPMAFDGPVDPDFETIMLNQSVGSWDHTAIPRNPRIWVAGCGTNQAVFTALRFPKATVLGSDLSTRSLATSERVARQLGITNLELRNESINAVSYQDRFDYILCTGVIHHNADPRGPLHKLAAALKPTGILELMVYNRYHRTMTTAFQKAIAGFVSFSTRIDFDSELQLARKIVKSHHLSNNMAKFLEHYASDDCSEQEFADSLLQPVEHSYTIESLAALASACNLDLVTYCVNQFDKAKGTIFWNMEFHDADLQSRYEALPDLQRWQISNHLMLEDSPQLWFFLQRQDSGRKIKSEQELAAELLDQRFVVSRTNKRVLIRQPTGDYLPAKRLAPYPGDHGDDLCRRIIARLAAEPGRPLRDLCGELGIASQFPRLNTLRLTLTTSGFPFLIAVPERPARSG